MLISHPAIFVVFCIDSRQITRSLTEIGTGLLFSFNLSLFANCRSQFLLDRLGRCLNLFVLTESTTSPEFASQFGLAIFYTRKTPKNHREDRVSRKCLLNEQASAMSKRGATPVTVDRSPATAFIMIADNIDHSGDRLSQNGRKQQVKTATRVYTFTT